jgi:cytochrome P450
MFHSDLTSLQMKGPLSDVSHWLIDASLKKGSLEADREWLNGDALTIVIAGSDTIAPTLVFVFYELALSPLQQSILLEELRLVDINDHAQLKGCAHLTAVINETLRLHPAIPSGGYRQTPPSGLTIGDTYIPGNITIVSPRYSLARLETSYQFSDKWIPERWTTKPEMVMDARGFAPFSQGKFNCVGKGLAMSEMRFVIALLVKKFTVDLAEGEKGQKLFADLRDQFTASPGSLNLKFRLRD